MKVCPTCGNQCMDDAVSCEKCESAIGGTKKSRRKKGRATAAGKTPLEVASTRIKTAAIMGFISMVVTALVAVLAHYGVEMLLDMGFSIRMLIDALVVGGLAAGLMASKSRVCAIILFVYYCLGQISTLYLSDFTFSTSSIVNWVIWGGSYFMGMSGALNYHKLIKEQRAMEAAGFSQMPYSHPMQGYPPPQGYSPPGYQGYPPPQGQPPPGYQAYPPPGQPPQGVQVYPPPPGQPLAEGQQPLPEPPQDNTD